MTMNQVFQVDFTTVFSRLCSLSKLKGSAFASAVPRLPREVLSAKLAFDIGESDTRMVRDAYTERNVLPYSQSLEAMLQRRF